MSEAGWLAYRREKNAIQAETGGSPAVRPLHTAPAPRGRGNGDASRRGRTGLRGAGSTRAPSPAVAPPADVKALTVMGNGVGGGGRWRRREEGEREGGRGGNKWRWERSLLANISHFTPDPKSLWFIRKEDGVTMMTLFVDRLDQTKKKSTMAVTFTHPKATLGLGQKIILTNSIIISKKFGFRCQREGCFSQWKRVLFLRDFCFDVYSTRGGTIVSGKKRKKILTLEIRLWNSDHKNGKIEQLLFEFASEYYQQ